MKKPKTYYLHTLDGQPADFSGEQVCYAVHYGKPNKLATSLKQIRREQQASREYRERIGFENDCEYGYRRYSI